MDQGRAAVITDYKETYENDLREHSNYGTNYNGEIGDTASANANIRRGAVGRLDRMIRAGELVIDVKNFLLWVGGEYVELRRREFELLVILASRPAQLVTRDELATEIWGNAEVRSSRTIDVHVQRLRAALAKRSSHSYVRTVRGFGYRFVERGWVASNAQPRTDP